VKGPHGGVFGGMGGGREGGTHSAAKPVSQEFLSSLPNGAPQAMLIRPPSARSTSMAMTVHPFCAFFCPPKRTSTKRPAPGRSHVTIAEFGHAIQSPPEFAPSLRPPRSAYLGHHQQGPTFPLRKGLDPSRQCSLKRQFERRCSKDSATVSTNGRRH